MRTGVEIHYGDVSPEAKENFTPTASESKFDTLNQLQQYNLLFPNYGNPCEKYSVLLDGEAELLPEDNEGLNIGLVSENLSESNGTFTVPIVLTLESVGQYSSQGLTLTFDTYNEIFATDINIKWYRVVEGVETLLDEKNFNSENENAPDSAFYFCQNQVSNYNKVVITFVSINMPDNRLRLRAIDYGYGTVFYGDELRNVKLIQEIDPISTQISINTVDFTLDSDDIEYSFQRKQPLNVYFNGILRATTFVKSSKRTAKYVWNVQSEDYIGLMDSTPFYGGMYDNKNAVELLEEIFETAKVPYTISEDFENMTVSGYIPYTTCREALMQVAFAIMAVVDTSNSATVNVFKIDTTPTQTIPLIRIMQGQNFDEDSTVTAVMLDSHSWKPLNERKLLYGADETPTGAIGDERIVTFNEPHYDYSGIGYSVKNSGVNYVHYIQTGSIIAINGLSYQHYTTRHQKTNPVVSASELENVVTIEKATLISDSNVDDVLEHCFDWLKKTDTTNLKIIEGKTVTEHGKIKYGQYKYGAFKYGADIPPTIVYDEPVNVGETIQAETQYMGIVEGVVIKQTYGLNGNIIVKDTVMK